MAYSTAVQLLRGVLEGPLTRPPLLKWRRRQFLSPDGFASYFGVFSSFDEARRFLPSSPEFDEEALTQEHVSVRTKRVFTYDYPMLWWLSSAFKKGALGVLDVGGSVGVHYYAYRKFMPMPHGLRWTIVEVPAVARVGERLALEQQAASLVFTVDLMDAVSRSDADIWLSAGALQYLEHPDLAALLRRCEKRPQHILLNKLPLYDGDNFVTTQNLGNRCFAPVHIFNRRRFVESLVREGYVLQDEWSVYERSFYLPGFAERSFPCFSGLYFVAEKP